MKLSIITDELGDDLPGSLAACERLGLDAVELRTVAGRTVLDLTDAELDDAIAQVRERGLAITALATPVLKCSLPGAPAPVGALHGARAKATLEDSWAQLDRALELATRHEIPFVRIFSGWRVPDPSRVFDAVVAVVDEAQRRSQGTPTEILLENEHDCNVATARETRALLDRLPGLRVLWDPGNHVRAGGDPSEAALNGSRRRVAHVHVKDVDEAGAWVPFGSGRVPYGEIVARLREDGFDGFFSLETHCELDGSVERASRLALERLGELAQVGRA